MVETKEGEGEEEGDICNREKCTGIIEKKYSDRGCSCHINPPCSFCETPLEFCPICEWDFQEERDELDDKYIKSITQEQKDKWQQDLDKRAKIEQTFKRKYNGREKIKKFDCRKYSHSNSSMRVQGVFPIKKGIKPYMDKIRGTFGGRFEYLNMDWGRFIYIAYTD